MAVKDWFAGLIKPTKNTYSSGNIGTTNTPEHDPVSDFGGSRATIPRFTMGGGGSFGALPRKTQRELDLSDPALDRADVEDLIDILVDAHPDVSFAVWNFLRLANSGYEINVTNVDNDEEFEQGKEEVDLLVKRLSQPNIEQFQTSRDLDKVINQLVFTTVTRGASALEIVPTDGFDDVAFFAAVDPITVDFLYENERFVPYQNDEEISLDIPTFFYEELDPFIDDPYGRSPILGALNTVLFQLQVLNDVKAVVHNQGYPRFDITILEEVLLKRMPIAIRNNEAKKQKWLNDKLNEIIQMYNDLDPDDAFVHFNSIEVDTAGGGKGGGAMIDPEKLMSALDGLVTAGLKTLSTILGRRSSGNTESFAKLEIKLYMKGVEGIQRVVERALSKAFTLFLNMKGLQGYAQFKFKPIEVRTDLETEQFRQIKLINIQFMRDQGWIDQFEASMMAVGHAPVAEGPINNETPENKDGDTPSGDTDEKVVDDSSNQPE